MISLRRYVLFFSTCIGAALPTLARAHEVYVLSPTEIQAGLSEKPFSMLAVIAANFTQFVFWGFVAAVTVFLVFFISIIRPFEQWIDPVLLRLRRFAAPVARSTIGISFLAAAYYQATYGPELPLNATFGAYAGAITIVLIVIGVLITFGIYTRAAALVALVLFTNAVLHHGIYMLTYTNYLGEIILLLVLGAHHGTAPHTAFRKAHEASTGFEHWLRSLAKRFAPYSFFILRVSFGVSLLYASLYAKILHNQLALMVAELPLAGHLHSIASVFGFSPDFMVLGASIVEILIAIFFIFGIEIRFTSLFLLFWLSLSLWYFGEVVWPHIILIGIPVAFIFYGYDRYSLEGRFFKKNGWEPVL